MYSLQNASAVTTSTRELMRKAKAFVDREIVLIPNGIDSDRFKPMERNEALADPLGIEVEKEERVIGFVGALRKKKGLITLLRASAQVSRSRPTTLLIVGDIRVGEDKEQFDQLKSSILNPKIIVTGYVSNSDRPSYYSLMEVMVHLSLRHGLPNALLEAMACETPVIATPVGGVLDVVNERRRTDCSGQ